MYVSLMRRCDSAAIVSNTSELPAPGHPGEDGQLPLRNVQADVAQVVLAGAAHLDGAPVGGLLRHGPILPDGASGRGTRTRVSAAVRNGHRVSRRCGSCTVCGTFRPSDAGSERFVGRCVFVEIHAVHAPGPLERHAACISGRHDGNHDTALRPSSPQRHEGGRAPLRGRDLRGRSRRGDRRACSPRIRVAHVRHHRERACRTRGGHVQGPRQPDERRVPDRGPGRRGRSGCGAPHVECHADRRVHGRRRCEGQALHERRDALLPHRRGPRRRALAYPRCRSQSCDSSAPLPRRTSASRRLGCAR